MNNIFKNMLTESDNVTHDLARYLALISVLVGLGLSIYAVGWKGQQFDLQSFGVGMGAMFTGLGVALKLKPETPP